MFRRTGIARATPVAISLVRVKELEYAAAARHAVQPVIYWSQRPSDCKLLSAMWAFSERCDADPWSGATWDASRRSRRGPVLNPFPSDWSKTACSSRGK